MESRRQAHFTRLENIQLTIKEEVRRDGEVF